MKTPLKVAIVHDYLNEFGGAERVLLALTEIWPDAPIYTAFYKEHSPAWERFQDKDLRPSWVQRIPFFASKLHSPLRFLAPWIWNRFDLTEYDVIISSASWYITKGFTKKRKNAIEICYCHTPPRWLYGYPTSVEFQKYWPVRVYAHVVGHFMRLYDWYAAQRVDYFIANSENVARRIKKFYRREATVIYPPVDQPKSELVTKKDNYYLVTSRIVGGKGLDLAVKAAVALGLHLKIAGKAAGYASEYQNLVNLAKQPGEHTIEFLGYVSDDQLRDLYAHAKAFFALASDEDFGITPVESMMHGTPVIAFRGGGYVESVVENKTGVFFEEQSVESVIEAIKTFEKKKFDAKEIAKYAQKFSKERFQKEVEKFVAAKKAIIL
ncbi:MAG TPA: glycosyltransferase [Patescibacteria group bacterium]